MALRFREGALSEAIRRRPTTFLPPSVPAMFLGMLSASPWTSVLVGEHLVAAFRRVPGCPVLSSARRFSMGEVEVEPFGWPERFIASRQDRGLLMTWARCRAMGEPVAPLYRELLGNAERADYRRRVALATIAHGLNVAVACQASLTIPDVASEAV